MLTSSFDSSATYLIWRSQVRAQLEAAAVEERPDEGVFARMHRRRARGSGAANEAKEKRFGLVVARVAERDDVGRQVRSSPLEEGVARRARSVFDGASLAFGPRRHILAVRQQRQTKRGGDAFAEALVLVGRGAKLVIEMRQADDLQIARFREGLQQPDERHRIGSARERDDHARLGPREIVSANRLPDAGQKIHRGEMVPEGGFEPPTPRL